MSRTFTYIKGMAELKRDYDALPADLRRLALKRGAYAGAAATRPAVYARTPIAPKRRFVGGRARAPGLLKASLITVFDGRRSNDTQAVYLLRFREKKAAYYAKWVERGHRIVPRFKGKYTDYPLRGRGRLTGLAKRRAAATGFVPGRFMLQRGFASSQQQALNAMLDALQRGAAQAGLLARRA